MYVCVIGNHVVTLPPYAFCERPFLTLMGNRWRTTRARREPSGTCYSKTRSTEYSCSAVTSHSASGPSSSRTFYFLPVSTAPDRLVVREYGALIIICTMSKLYYLIGRRTAKDESTAANMMLQLHTVVFKDSIQLYKPLVYCYLLHRVVHITFIPITAIVVRVSTGTACAKVLELL